MRHLILEILDVLSKDELKEFRVFLRSPYFNSSERVIEIYDALIPFHRKFKDEKLTHNYLHSKLKTKAKFNLLTINTLLNDLCHLAVKFLKHEVYDNAKEWEYVFLLDELCRRNSAKLYRKIMKQLEKKPHTYKTSGGDYFMKMYYTERLKYNYSASQGIMPGNKLMKYELKALENTNKYLICFSITELIKGYNSMISFYDSYNLNPEIDFVYSFLKRRKFQKMLKMLIENDVFAEYKYLFELFHALTLTLGNMKKISYYYNLKELIYKYTPQLNKDDICSFYGYLVDYCVGARKKKLLNELTDVYNTILQNGYYKNTIYDYIQVDIWRNIFLHGIRTNNIKWLEEIIVKYQNELHPDNKDNLVNYSFALMNFSKKKFNKSLDYLTNLKLDYFVFKLDALNLKMKIFYELSYSESAIDLMDTYSKDLMNMHINSKIKKGHLNFLRFFKIILSCKSGTKQINLNKLKRNVELSVAQQRDWLLEKIKELKR